MSAKKDFPFLEHLIGPTIVGIVVLIGQFFLNPIIAHKEAQRTELIRMKQEAYLVAIDLVDKFYLSLPWKAADGQPRNQQLGIRPTREEINQCLAKIVLVEDTPTVSRTFLQCFGYGAVSGFSVAFKHTMVNEMRRDLYATKSIDIKDAPFIFTLDNLTDISPITLSTNK